MLGICFEVLSILGIMLLILLALLIGGVFLLLFFPFSYRLQGRRDTEGYEITAGIVWLFGLLRLHFGYPQPGHVKVKLLFFPLFDLDLKEDKKAVKTGAETPKNKNARKKRKKAEKEPLSQKRKREILSEKQKSADKNDLSGNGNTAAGEGSGKKAEMTGRAGTENCPERSTGNGSEGQPDGSDAGGEKTAGKETVGKETIGKETIGKENAGQEKSRISSEMEKIRYTFSGIYDKIKKIWKNIFYYAGLLQDEENKRMFSGSLDALGKILKSIRPRKVRADIRFGTGSPDTTGYIYGIYCMVFFRNFFPSGTFFPFGKNEIEVIPDFEEAVLQGELCISGRVALWILAVNGVRMYRLIKKLMALGAESA